MELKCAVSADSLVLPGARADDDNKILSDKVLNVVMSSWRPAVMTELDPGRLPLHFSNSMICRLETIDSLQSYLIDVIRANVYGEPFTLKSHSNNIYMENCRMNGQANHILLVQ